MARDGTLRTLARPEDLVVELRSVLQGEREPRSSWHGRIALDAAMAAAGALVLWILLVPGSDVKTAAWVPLGGLTRRNDEPSIRRIALKLTRLMQRNTLAHAATRGES